MALQVPKPAITIDPLSVHVALRKGSDTEWSALLYNLVSATPSAAWVTFCKVASWHYDKECLGQGLPSDSLRGCYEWLMEVSPLPEGLAEALGSKPGDMAWPALTPLLNASSGIALAMAFKLCDEQTLRDVDCWLAEVG